MRVTRIYTPAPLASDSRIILDEAATQHVAKVLRMQPGQMVVLFNGDGYDYPATLSEVSKKEVVAELGPSQPNELESPLTVVLGQVISKGDRMDYAIQKSVEMGVSTIVPLVSERCEVKLKGDREDKRLKHWQGVAISAAEQCGRAVVPSIEPVRSLADWFDYSQSCDLRLVLHHRTEKRLASLARPERLALLVGPEGGLSESEIAGAEAAGFLPAAMGPRVLRTETAPVAALALCQWLWGDGGQPGDYNP
ncbi:16S rRNA (uracil(1498)-N(3))-methyltransferase [Marinobacter salicampi]|uniref:16S rRNA (uracil(1498)-N(3))-methyltransferase n=1 Tax=Marinobacter salicampi TaxID=435907 RepID=UPI001407655A|nr:16S rRNA (uracil(1498)-N(3))-methyltransferase [Marinobacter salicampi]